MNERELYKKAIKKWGAQSQVLMACEEMGEMLSALSRYNRGRITEAEVHDCITDTWIMMEQMMVLFGMTNEQFKEIRAKKLAHLQALLNGKAQKPSK